MVSVNSGLFANKNIESLNARQKALMANNAETSGVIGKFIAEPLRNVLRTSGCKSKAENEYKKLEQSYQNVQVAIKSGNNDSIELSQNVFNEQQSNFDKTIKARESGNQIWNESIAHSISLVAGAELAALFKVPLKQAVIIAAAIGGTTKTALMGLNQLTSNNGKSYSTDKALKDFLTGGIDAALGFVGGVMGGRAFRATQGAGKIPAIAADVSTQALAGFTAGASVDLIYQAFDGDKIDVNRSVSSGGTTSLIFIFSSLLGHCIRGRFNPKSELKLHSDVNAGPATPCPTPNNHLKGLNGGLRSIKNRIEKLFRSVKAADDSNAHDFQQNQLLALLQKKQTPLNSGKS